MNDAITIYYYTAWDGFAWQGCDEATAKSLQGYMEATKTLPRSSADEPPFGGAVPCKISGRIGVAVYRYLTRRKGDLSGRDSLYIALAFIPLDVGCVDFSALLDLPQLTMPQQGELHPEEVSVSGLGLRLADVREGPGCWFDSDSAAEKYRVLRGRDGLRDLSTLFFSKYTQLGFLNAVFQSENGLDSLVSTQTYRIYPEITNVVVASRALREARRDGGGVLDRGHESVRKMNEALDQLDGWCERQRGYAGLREYHDEKKLELNDDGGKIRMISSYTTDMERMLRLLPDENDVQRKGMGVNDKDRVLRCAELAKKIAELPVLDHELYKVALRCSMDGMRRSAKLMCASECNHRVVEIESARRRAESELEISKKNAETKGRNDRKEIEELKTRIAELVGMVSKLKSKSRGEDAKHDLHGELILDSVRVGKKHMLFGGLMKWALELVVILLLSCLAILFIKKVFSQKGDDNGREGRSVQFSRGAVDVPVASNAVPVQTESAEVPIAGRPTSNIVDDVERDTFGDDARSDEKPDREKQEEDEEKNAPAKEQTWTDEENAE